MPQMSDKMGKLGNGSESAVNFWRHQHTLVVAT